MAIDLAEIGLTTAQFGVIVHVSRDPESRQQNYPADPGLLNEPGVADRVSPKSLPRGQTGSDVIFP